MYKFSSSRFKTRSEIELTRSKEEAKSAENRAKEAESKVRFMEAKLGTSANREKRVRWALVGVEVAHFCSSVAGR